MDQKWFIALYAGFYSRNPLISLIRDKIVLQLQLVSSCDTVNLRDGIIVM